MSKGKNNEIINPIFKKRNKAERVNYREIILPNVPYKIL